MSFWKDVLGDVRNWGVNLAMTLLVAGIIFVLAPVGAAILKAMRSEPMPWLVLIGIALVGVALILLAILFLRRIVAGPTQATNNLSRLSGQLDAKLIKGDVRIERLKQRLHEPATIATGERHFITDEALNDLLSSSVGRNALQVAKLTQPHLGMWARIHGKLASISAVGDHPVLGVQKHPEGERVGCMFNIDWHDKLEDLNVGDNVQVVGQIEKSSGLSLFLKNCELPG